MRWALTSDTSANDAAFYASTTFPDFFSADHKTFVLCCDRLEAIFLNKDTNNNPIDGGQEEKKSRNALMFDRLQMEDKEENAYLRQAAATNLSGVERNKYYGKQQDVTGGYNFAHRSDKQSANKLRTASNAINNQREEDFEAKAYAEATVTSRILISIASSLSILNLKMLLGFYSRIGQVGEFFRVLGAKIRTLRATFAAANLANTAPASNVASQTRRAVPDTEPAKAVGVVNDLAETRSQLENGAGIFFKPVGGDAATNE